MKTAIIYYSMSGNTEYVAEKIANKLKSTDQISLIKIAPVKAYPNKGAKKFIWGGKSAVMGDTPKLLPYEFNVDDYDRIIFGTPVWASTFVPPLKTFIKENPDVSTKSLAIFTCFSGGGADKAILKMKKMLGIEKFEAELILLDPKDNIKNEDDVKISEFCSALK